MRPDYDVIVVGAGPGGLACSSELARMGVSVAVLDEQAGPGGQIYRNVTHASEVQRGVLGPDYTDGAALVSEFMETGADYLPGSHVWQANPNGEVFLSRAGVSQRLSARHLVLGTGAMERPVPFEGWTLPGVMTCGGLSNLYKVSGLVPREPVVVAGSGPLLWLVAEHLFAMGAPVAAILDTTPRWRTLKASLHLPRAVLRLGYLLKGLGMIRKVRRMARRAGTPIHRGVRGLRADGADRVEQVSAIRGGKTLRFDATTLVVHEGIIPNSALLRQLGCAHRWDPVQRYWFPETAADGQTSLDAVSVTGDGAFVHGAVPAQLKGRLTALGVARKLGALGEEDHRARCQVARRSLHRELLPRPFVDALYAPRRDLFRIDDETTFCRCEGITAGRLRQTVKQGVTDHNDIKLLLRCGMGPCQGRMCGSALMELVEEVSGLPVTKTPQLRARPPIKPVGLHELAAARLESDEG